jgi:hypothetical protein
MRALSALNLDHWKNWCEDKQSYYTIVLKNGRGRGPRGNLAQHGHREIIFDNVYFF